MPDVGWTRRNNLHHIKAENNVGHVEHLEPRHRPAKEKAPLLVPPKSVMADPETQAKEAAAAAAAAETAARDATLGGKDRKTLYGIVFYGAWGTPSARNAIIAIPTVAQGYTGRAK